MNSLVPQHISDFSSSMHSDLQNAPLPSHFFHQPFFHPKVSLLNSSTIVSSFPQKAINNDKVTTFFNSNQQKSVFITINNYLVCQNNSSGSPSNVCINDINDSDSKIDEFKISIQNLVKYLESNEGEQSAISPSAALGINKRRLYDIINVFNSIGYCKKTHLDSIIWIGKSNIKIKFDSLIKQNNLYDWNISLDELFPQDNCVGISNITSSFILMFYALKTDHLDIRQVSHFFARKASRLKTTLSKIYQIIHILSSIDLMKKSLKVGEVIITNDFFNIDVIPENNINESQKDLKSIKYLLNDKSSVNEAIIKRRNELKNYKLKK